MPSPGVLTPLERVLADGHLAPVYQPLVRLDTFEPVGFEALARGPVGTDLANPAELFGAARAEQRLADLDSACMAAAYTGATDAGLTAPWTLFVNVEPEVADLVVLPVEVSADAGVEPVRIVVELTERALAADPAAVLRLVDRIRARGWGIALDDVGANTDSLALLPLVQPDVIKLDLSLIQGKPTARIARVFNAVSAEAERTGGIVLAEGIETEEHLRAALALGAQLGQGWYFGRPGPLPTELPAAPALPVHIRHRPVVDPTSLTSFELAALERPVRTSTKDLLIEVCKHLERQAADVGEACILLAAFQSVDRFTEHTKKRYRQLVDGAAYIGVLGVDVPDHIVPGVRGVSLDPDDPLAQEWDVVVVGPHFAGVLVARDTADGRDGAEHVLEYVLSYDRDLAVSIATGLMARMQP